MKIQFWFTPTNTVDGASIPVGVWFTAKYYKTWSWACDDEEGEKVDGVFWKTEDGHRIYRVAREGVLQVWEHCRSSFCDGCRGCSRGDFEGYVQGDVRLL